MNLWTRGTFVSLAVRNSSTRRTSRYLCFILRCICKFNDGNGNQAEVYETYQHPPNPYAPTLSHDNYVATGPFSEQHDATAKLVASRHVTGKYCRQLAMIREVTNRPLWHGESQQTQDNPNRVRSLLMSEKNWDLKNLSVCQD